MNRTDFDIAICGGGMVGATLTALLLREPSLRDLRIALIEARFPTQAPGSEVDLRVSAISRASQRILEHAGAWSSLNTAQRSPYSEMVVWDAANKSDDEQALCFSASALGEPDLGHIVANNCLQWAALEAAHHENVTRFATELSGISVDDDAAQVKLVDGRRFSARLVIGADGARSASREFVGVETRMRPYQQSAVVTHVRTQHSHRQTAWQRFLPNGPIAFLPLNDGRSSIVWTTTPEHAAELLQLGDAELGEQIAVAFDHVLGEVSVAAPRAAFPLQLAQVDEYCRPRFVLVGDAAHSVHPLAGQGVNLGFMDAAALVQVLSEARQAGASKESLSELRVLRRYERWRKTENTLALGLIDGLNRMFSNQQPGLSMLRRSGLRLVQQLPLAKRALMMRALGLAGERPAIVRNSLR
ncbi:MAG: UbiH/UbiF/VisC/COQ6 family ubiquinone biosynthesis hydroxylase [Steroidobacteraceae bacterium]